MFDTGDAIYVIAVDGDGDMLESKKTYLRVTEPVTQGSTGGDSTIKIFDAFSFTIPDDKPVLGNQTFSLDLGLIDFKLELDDGDFKAVLGVNFEQDEDGKFSVSEFKNFKETIKDAKSKIIAGATVSTIHNTLRKKGYGKFSNIEVKSGWSPEASIAGYIEGTVNSEGNLIPTEGGIIVTASLEYEYQGQAFIVVVPVYYSIGAGGEIEVSLGVKGMVAGDGFNPIFSGNLEIAPFFEIGGGIGVVYLGQVGARGKATLAFNIALDENYQKVDLTGQAYFEIKALSFTAYEKEFASGTWTVYETGRESTSSLMGEAEDIYASIDINAQATPEGRSYLDNPSVWLGEDVPMSLMEADYTNKELRVLEENAYPDAMPQIMSVDGKKALIWITDNAERSDENKSMLVYSLYDDESDTWAEPVAVMDDGTADFYPQAVGKYVVWQKAGEEFGEGVSLAEVGGSCDIYIAEFNGAGFDTPVRLTENDVLDAQPTVAVDGDAAAVIWTENSDNNILGYSGENSILVSEFDGEAWSEPAVLAEGLNTVASISAGYMAGEMVIAYSYDEDNDLNTIDDREIYLIRGGETTRFTENETLDSNPKFAAVNGETALFWYNEGNIYYTTDVEDVVISSVSAEGINALSDDYCVFSNGDDAAVIWTSVENGVSEVYGALYDGLQWSCDVEITQEGEFVKYPSGIIEDDGKLIIAFNRTENVEDGDYYTDGSSDLCVMGVTPSYDIAVSGAYLAENIAPNAENEVYFTLENKGELAVEGITAAVYDVDGELNGEYTFDMYLQPGESEELEVYYITGEEIVPGEVTIIVTLSEGEEYDETNNEALLTVGESDLEITSISTEGEGAEHTVTLTLKNSGYSTAENAVAEIRENGESGSLLAKKYLGDIAPQEEKTVTFTIDERGIPTENSFVILSGSVTCESDETTLGNNYENFTIDLSNEAKETEWSCVIDSVTLSENAVTVAVTGEGKITAAAYSADGTLLAASAQSAADGEATLALNYENAAYIKVFVWSSLTPLCLSAEIGW
ncbi:MAG: hypothetical protein LUG52_00520 [Clostridia bacterium]|nr:hypothetical protein [Clostridia bacterium]